jgi:GNAT superfamily N-acetyltransferase
LTELRIAPARTPSELGSFLSIGRIVHPGPMPSVDGLLHELETSPETVFLLASLGDVAVGTGVGKTSSVGDAYYSMARVLPARRGAGVGTAILSSLSDHARRAGRRSLIGRLREDDAAARRFVERRGFSVLSRECPVVLDLSSFEEPAGEPPVGVEIASLAERPDLVAAAYAVDASALRDVPVGSEAPSARPYEEWVAATVDAPDALPGLSLVALVDGEVVGWAGLRALSGEEGAAENLLTGVLREARGRGIATGLKIEQARRAKQAGFLRIETVNDEANAPMRAVNARLGYEAEPVWLLVRGPLA